MSQDRFKPDPTSLDIERAWSRPRLYGAGSQDFLSRYYSFTLYGMLAFTYLWRGMGAMILTINSLSIHRGESGYLPIWTNLLIFIAIYAIGYIIAYCVSRGIRWVTGRPPWAPALPRAL